MAYDTNRYKNYYLASYELCFLNIVIHNKNITVRQEIYI